MSKEDFIHLAEIITQIFETETAKTYYNPPSKGKVPTGKLFSCYSNLRTALSSVGLIARETRKSSSNLRNETTEPIEIAREIVDAQAVIESINFEDFDVLLEAWKLTLSEREKILKTTISTSDFLHKYPYLTEPLGYQLVRLV